ncbi:MAG: CapA family protein [Ignavibacteria bacterium]|nr:CapA family protein [Ignavibacteria bacterium]
MPRTYKIVSLLITVLLSCNNDKTKIPEDKPELREEQKNSIDEVFSVIMVGDIMLGTNYPSSSSLPPDDGKYILDNVKEILQNADLTIGNLEGTLLNSGGTPKQCLNPSNCVAFRMPEHYAGYLKEAGFDVMSVANNHSGDMGETGRESTMKTLDRYRIKHAGYLKQPEVIFEVKGVRFGFTAFAPNVGTQSLLNLQAAEERVKNLKKICKIVIVSFHGGAEGSGATGVNRKQEYYLGENRGNVYEFSHKMIDAGADIVFGHGPHVPRAVELYKDRIIAYSLGNFCTYAKFGLSGPLGYAPILKVKINNNGEFLEGEIISAHQLNRGIPYIDKEHKAARLIKKLTEKDFPDSQLIISDTGSIKRIK